MADQILPLPILSHMPPHVKQQISEALDVQTQSSLRQCSKDFRDVVDTSATHYEGLNIQFYENRVKIGVDSMEWCYQTHPEGYMTKTNGPRARRYRVVRGNGTFIDRTLRFIESIFKNSRKSVWRLEFDFAHRITSIRRYQQMKDEFIEKMNQFMARTPYLLPITILSLRLKMNDEDVLKFLRYCQPGTLEHIHLMHRERDDLPDNFLAEVAETEHWRQAKVFSQIDFPLTLPYDKWSHLKFTFLEVKSLPLQTLTSLIQNFLLNPDWDSVSLRHLERNRELVNYFKSLPLFKPGSKHRRIAVPGSESLVIKLEYRRQIQLSLSKVDLEEEEEEDSDEWSDA